MASQVDETIPDAQGDQEPLILKSILPMKASLVKYVAASSFLAVATLCCWMHSQGNGHAIQINVRGSFETLFDTKTTSQTTYTAGPAKWTHLKTYPWEDEILSLETVFDQAFTQNHPWKDVKFTEGLSQTPLTKAGLLKWIRNELLTGTDPFAAWNGEVPIPTTAPNTPDQVDPGHWVSYSRRQTCFIAAKSLVGAGTSGYANGLKRYLGTVAPAEENCTPRSGDFGRGLFYLLASCAEDPGLENGGQGPLLLVAKATEPPSIENVLEAGKNVPLARAGLRTCQYNDGASDIAGMPKVPSEGCVQPTELGPGKDFMTPGGLRGQALQDISASWLGGYIWGYGCGLGGGQDERLMTYMPEVFVFAFFLSEAPGTDPQKHHTPQLRQPAWILGARLLMVGLDGTAKFNSPPVINADVEMVSDLVDIDIEGKGATISGSRPFLAFMSENQDYELSEGCPGVLDEPECDRACRTRAARINRLGFQRAVDHGCKYSFANQVRAWYNSAALTSYAGEVQGALRKVVKSLGSGPWGSGLWWGDSQTMTLAMWIGHAIAANTWTDAGREEPLPLDYYFYSAFTENPGNQCYNHAGESCRSCLKTCGTPAPSAYWLPGFAYSGVDLSYEGWAPPKNSNAKACVVDEKSCGEKGFGDVYKAYKTQSAHKLWNDVEKVLRGPAAASNVNTNPFDALLS